MRLAMDATFTRADYMRLPEGFPAQLIDGTLVKETPPTFGHQGNVLEIAVALRGCAPGRVVVSPTDVLIDEHNVFQPDVVVHREVPNPRARHADAPPILVVEVCSPRSHARDVGWKRA